MIIQLIFLNYLWYCILKKIALSCQANRNINSPRLTAQGNSSLADLVDLLDSTIFCWFWSPREIAARQLPAPLGDVSGQPFSQQWKPTLRKGAVPGVVPNVCILLPHPYHHTSAARAANNAREKSSWCIITGQPSLDHSSSIVTDKRLDILTVSHFLQVLCKR